MAFGKFVRKLFGGKGEAPAISADPFQRETPAAPLPSGAPPAPLWAPPPPVLLLRDEVIDARTRLAGYLFHLEGEEDGSDGRAAAFHGALEAAGIAAFAQRRMAVIPLRLEDWRQRNFRPFIGPHLVFLLAVPAGIPPSELWAPCLQEMKSLGARVALRMPDPAACRDLLPLADILLLDYRADALERFERLAAALRRTLPDVALAAAGISSWTERRMVTSWGVEYCLGGFAATVDEEDKTDALDQNRLVLVEMLNLLRREADPSELAAVARRDPGIALRIVSMANSPVSGLDRPVASIEDALMVLGREMLYRWLSIALFQGGRDRNRDETLLELALGRARFLELLALAGGQRRESGELFLVGLFSMLDSLLSMPMPRILERMTLPPAVTGVLLDSAGPHARHLMLALALEKGRADQAAKLAAAIGATPELVAQCSRDALAWAEEAMGHG